jgi:hypothetical protein
MADSQQESLPEMIAELLDGWKDFVTGTGTGPNLTDWRGRSEAQVATIMTLTAHVHATATILRPAIPDELTIAHMPLVRSIFESTITIAWCDEVADGALSLVTEGARQRRALRRSLEKSRTMSEMADQISGTDWSRLPTSSTPQARSIEQRCDDVALNGAYAFYRMLSGLSHVSIETIDAYLDAESFIPGEPMSVKSNPGPISSSPAWSHLVASCLVWSGHGRQLPRQDPQPTQPAPPRRSCTGHTSRTRNLSRRLRPEGVRRLVKAVGVG